LIGYSSSQSGQLGDSDEFDSPNENYDDDSHDTPPQVDEVAGPLFKPVFSLPTRDTGDSQTSGGRASDIVYFFVVCGKDEKKRVCRICGYVLVQYDNECFVDRILARNTASRKFQRA
jgi:hypothetical protein